MSNSYLKLMASRLGYVDLPEPVHVDDTDKDMATRLSASGGYAQQNRMIRDKRKTLDRVVLYSYQGAKVQKMDEPQVRALITPNQVKQNYDDKIISIGYEFNYKPGDVFEWCNTNTHWLIYLQDLTELAYFKGDIRKCSYTVDWEDDEGEKHKSYMALEGPSERKIASGIKHEISIDTPNYLISFMVPKNEANEKFFQRYQKFYLQEMEGVCWRVEAINSISIPGIIKVSAKEYYANEFEDDIEGGTAGTIIKPVDPNPDPPEIEGKVFIKPKTECEYWVLNVENSGNWAFSDNKLPIDFTEYVTNDGFPAIKLKWVSNYSGQFDLIYEINGNKYEKTIVVESLF